MITDHAIDEALIEIMRTKKALEALRKARKTVNVTGDLNPPEPWTYYDQWREQAAAKRASMDLTRSLAKLRAGK
jgi:hypothetical protein